MTVEVRAFARARELLGGRLTVELAEPATVGDLWAELCRREPGLGDFKLTGLAVNQEYVPLTAPLADGDEVAIIPPVSGG